MMAPITMAVMMIAVCVAGCFGVLVEDWGNNCNPMSTAMTGIWVNMMPTSTSRNFQGGRSRREFSAADDDAVMDDAIWRSSLAGGVFDGKIAPLPLVLCLPLWISQEPCQERPLDAGLPAEIDEESQVPGD